MKKEKRTLSYRMVKEYFRFIINGLYYRKFYSIDSQNIPADGTPVLIVSDHQFCLNDALGVLLAVNDRMMHEGEESLGNNRSTFQLTEQNLLDGRSILIYPEAGHQTRHWLQLLQKAVAEVRFLRHGAAIRPLRDQVYQRIKKTIQ